MPINSIVNIKRFKLSVEGLVQPDANQKLRFKSAPPISPKTKSDSITLFSFLLNKKYNDPKVIETAVRNSPHIIRLPKNFEFGMTVEWRKSLYNGLGLLLANFVKVGTKVVTNFPPVILPMLLLNQTVPISRTTSKKPKL